MGGAGLLCSAQQCCGRRVKLLITIRSKPEPHCMVCGSVAVHSPCVLHHLQLGVFAPSPPSRVGSSERQPNALRFAASPDMMSARPPGGGGVTRRYYLKVSLLPAQWAVLCLASCQRGTYIAPATLCHRHNEGFLKTQLANMYELPVFGKEATAGLAASLNKSDSSTSSAVGSTASWHPVLLLSDSSGC
jgi:hypothetical protein